MISLAPVRCNLELPSSVRRPLRFEQDGGTVAIGRYRFLQKQYFVKSRRPQHVGQGADRWLKRLWVHSGQGMLDSFAEKAPAIVIFDDGRFRFGASDRGKPQKTGC